MSNLVPVNQQLPAHLASRVAQGSNIASSLAGGLSSASYPRISIKGGRFRIVEGQIETILPDPVLRAVIVGANPGISKTFYKDKWDPKADTKAPDCYSMDGVKPNADATDPQATMCANCPQNQWGSKISEQGSKVKACSDTKRLAIIAADDPSGPVYLFQVTPAALQNLGKYQKQLAAQGYPPELVITNITMDPNESYPKAVFSFGGFISEDVLPIIDEVMQSPMVAEVTGETTQVAGAAQTVVAHVVQAAPPPPPPPPPPVPEQPRRGFGAAPASDIPHTIQGAVQAAQQPQQQAHTQTREPLNTTVVASDSITDEIKNMLADLGT